MSQDEPIVRIERGDELYAKVREFGNGLRPIDAGRGWFYQVVSELLDATLYNYRHLKTSYKKKDYPRLGWACRNLLELTIFTKYVLISAANARRFGQDRLVDGWDIIRSLKALELHYTPKSDTSLLDDALSRMQAQMRLEGVAETQYLRANVLADVVGMRADYTYINRVCSKLVHPTAWSLLAMNKEDNSFSQSLEMFFGYGVMYLGEVYLAIKTHDETHGMKPSP